MIASPTNSQITQKIPALLTKEIQDLYIRENFQSLEKYFSAQNQLVNFNFFEIDITEAVTDATLNHNLKYTPKDIVVTQMTGSGTIQFLFGEFDSTSISYTATGPCRVRFFVGTYFKDQSSVEAQSTDVQSVVATPSVAGTSSVVHVTGNYTMTGQEYLVRVTTASQGAGPSSTITLPLGVKGLVARIQKEDAGNAPVSVLVNPAEKAGAQIVPAWTNFTVQYQSAEMIFDGTNWCIYSKWSGT